MIGRALAIICMLFLWPVLITPSLSKDLSALGDEFGCQGSPTVNSDGDIVCRVSKQASPRKAVRKVKRIVHGQRACDPFLKQFAGLKLMDMANPNAKTVCVVHGGGLPPKVRVVK